MNLVVINDDEVAFTDADGDFIASLAAVKISGMKNAYTVVLKLAKGIDSPEEIERIAVTRDIALAAERRIRP